MKSEATGGGFIAFKGKKFIYIGTGHAGSGPICFCKALTNEELKLIDDNPAIIESEKEIYHLLIS